MPAINNELERINNQSSADIADGAGVYAGTNPPRVLNIAMAISDGKTLNIAHACDIFYGNEPESQTISEAIAKGVEGGSPYASIDDILRAVEANEVAETSNDDSSISGDNEPEETPESNDEEPEE